MESIGSFFTWLFNTRPGVVTLLAGGVVIMLIVAWRLEKRMRKEFYNHKKSKDDWDLFGD